LQQRLATHFHRSSRIKKKNLRSVELDECGFDFAEAITSVGAPSFADFAKGGNRTAESGLVALRTSH
jgi:hypothetical protein